MKKGLLVVIITIMFFAFASYSSVSTELKEFNNNIWGKYIQNNDEPIEKNYSFAAFGLNDGATIEASYKSFAFGFPRTVDGRTARFILIFNFEATVINGSFFVYGFIPFKYNVTPPLQEYYISEGDTISMGFIYTCVFIDSWVLRPEGTTTITDREDFHFGGMSALRGGIILYDYPPYYSPE